jgi:uncharacterized protein (TIGR04255 family)
VIEPSALPLPEYAHPPVIEVVCGIQFREINALLAPYLGLLWQKYMPEFATCEEHSVFGAPIESLDGDPKLRLKIEDKPPLPRVWYVHAAGNAVIQVQRNCFLHNWRKAKDTDEYPRFAAVIRQFRKHLGAFEAFLNENNLGSLAPTQCELTYINHIPNGKGWENISDVGNLFPDFAWKGKGERFLPEPDGINWRTSFILPDRVGRLHATIRRARRTKDGRELILLELCARGFPKSWNGEAMWLWYELAHEWIVRGFADITSQQIQSDVWKRKERV